MLNRKLLKQAQADRFHICPKCGAVLNDTYCFKCDEILTNISEKYDTSHK